MKKIIRMAVGLVLCLAVCGCGDKEVTEVSSGEYISGNGSKITIYEENELLMESMDFSEVEKNTYESYAISQKKQEQGRELTEEEIEKICSEIDLASQFMNQKSAYTIQQEEGILGIYLPVKGSELYLYLQYFPADNTIVWEDTIFSLKK